MPKFEPEQLVEQWSFSKGEKEGNLEKNRYLVWGDNKFTDLKCSVYSMRYEIVKKRHIFIHIRVCVYIYIYIYMYIYIYIFGTC